MENAKDKKEEQTKNADTSAAREMRCSCAGYMERIKAIDSMEDMEQNVWEALHMFRKLNIGSILPHLNKGEFVLMNGIYHVQKKISSGHGVKMSDLAEYTHALPPAVSRSMSDVLWIRKTEEIHWWRLQNPGRRFWMNPMRLRMNLSAGYLKKRIKKKWRGW